MSLGGTDPLTVAGVQPKASDAMITVPVEFGRGGVGYLLELSPVDYPRLVENEAWSLRLARDAGLRTASMRLIHDREGRSALVVERFDRVRTPHGVQPLHQEDGCQLLDRYPAEKYRISINELLEALELCTAPLVERLRLLELHAFSYLITNGDLHAKNVSVLVEDGRVQLAPAYDLVATLPYQDTHMALKMDGRDANLKRSQFLATADRFGVRSSAMMSMLDRLVARVGAAATTVAEIGLDERRTKHLERTILERCSRLGR